MSIPADDMHFLHSAYREKWVEHLFVGELQRNPGPFAKNSLVTAFGPTWAT